MSEVNLFVKLSARALKDDKTLQKPLIDFERKPNIQEALKREV